MLTKINKETATLETVIDKLNELIDYVISSEFEGIQCDRLVPLNNETTLSAEKIQSIAKRDVWDLEPNPLTSKKCPHCGASYYSEGSTFTTAVYYPPIYKDGVNINPDRNSSTTTYHCFECGKDWTETV